MSLQSDLLSLKKGDFIFIDEIKYELIYSLGEAEKQGNDYIIFTNLYLHNFNSKALTETHYLEVFDNKIIFKEAKTMTELKYESISFERVSN